MICDYKLSENIAPLKKLVTTKKKGSTWSRVPQTTKQEEAVIEPDPVLEYNVLEVLANTDMRCMSIIFLSLLYYVVLEVE